MATLFREIHLKEQGVQNPDRFLLWYISDILYPYFSGLNLKGEPITLEGRGWLARIIQHEMDHLDGKLYIDCMTSKTFQNDAWHKINVHQGRVKIEFHKK